MFHEQNNCERLWGSAPHLCCLSFDLSLKATVTFLTCYIRYL